MIDILGTMEYRIGGQTQSMTNIVHSILLKRVNIDKTFLYQDYIIMPDETPEMVSQKLYGSVQYWYSILLVNNIVDPFAGLPMSFDVLVEYTRAKYGNENAIHHFFDNRTDRICDDRSSIKWRKMYEDGTLPEYILPVSNMQYEQELNEERTRIKVVNPKYILAFDEAVREMV